MKTYLTFSKYAKGFGVFTFAVMFVACSQLDIEPNQPCDNLRVLALEVNPSEPVGNPYFLPGASGGNVLCSEAAEFFGIEGGFEFTSPDPEGQGGNDYKGDNTFKESWPDGFTITVTNNTFVEWSFEPIYIDGVKYCLKNLVVLVKGGPGANAYYYGEGETGDSGLLSPVNQGGNTPDLSNLKLCYNLEPCPDDEPCYEFKDETAWSAGLRYNTRGNWATYTAYSAGSTVKLFAGQTLEAGTVSFSNPVI
jgi:hypothetical protein